MKGRKTGGRKKGSINKVSKELKDMIHGALDELGGQEYLVQQGRENPTAFISLLGRTLPKDLNVKATGGFSLSIGLSTQRNDKPTA